MISFCDFHANAFNAGLMLQKFDNQLNGPCTITASAIIGIENGQ